MSTIRRAVRLPFAIQTLSLLTFALLITTSAFAGVDSYTPGINVAAASGDTTATFTVTIANDNTSTGTITDVSITLPDHWDTPTSVSATSGSAAASGSAPWVISVSGLALAPGASVDVSFDSSACGTTLGTAETFTTSVNGGTFVNSTSDPSVLVTGTCTTTTTLSVPGSKPYDGLTSTAPILGTALTNLRYPDDSSVTLLLTGASANYVDPNVAPGIEVDFTGAALNDSTYYTLSAPLPTYADITSVDPTATVLNSPTYNGSPQAASVEIDGVNGETNISGTIDTIYYDGVASTPTNAGTYAVTVDFTSSNSNYNSILGLSAGNYTIQKANQTITFNTPGNQPNGTSFLATATAPATGGVTITVTGAGCTNTSGLSPLSVSAVQTGTNNCTMTATQGGDTNYNPAPPVANTISILADSITSLGIGSQSATPTYGTSSSANYTVTVSRTNPSCSGAISGSITITTSLPSGVTDNTPVAWSMANGVCSATPTLTLTTSATTPAGTTPFTISTTDNSSTPTTKTAAGSFTVNQAVSTLSSVSGTAFHGKQVTMSATLTGVGATPLAGESVTFTENSSGISCIGTTNGSGFASCTTVASLPNDSNAGRLPGVHVNGVTASFAGNVNYLSTGANGSLTVFDNPPTITAQTMPTLQQGSRPLKNQLIAIVSDYDNYDNPPQPPRLNVIYLNDNPDITITNITVDAAGNVYGDLSASCTATSGEQATLRVTDTYSVSADTSPKLTFTTINPNTPPVLSTYPNIVAWPGINQSNTPAHAPVDNGTVPTLLVTCIAGTGCAGGNLPNIGTLSGIGPTGVAIVKAPNVAVTTVYTIQVIAVDNCGLQSAPQTFQLTVNPASAYCGTFHPATVSPAVVSGGAPMIGMVSGAFTAPGRHDLVTANAGNNTIAIYPDTGSATFGTPTTLALSGLPTSIYAADLNNDGNMDVVVSIDSPGGVDVFLGTGSGLAAGVTYGSGGNNPKDLTIADLNDDGSLDIVVTNFSSNAFHLLVGVGNGTFTSGPTIAGGGMSGPWGVTAGYFDNDPYRDLAIANNTTSTVMLWRGDGTGNFALASTTTVWSHPRTLIQGDFGGVPPTPPGNTVTTVDGWKDVGVAAYDGGLINVLFNHNGDGTFTFTYGAQVVTPAGTITEDLQNDGGIDILSANTTQKTLWAFQGSNNGTFPGFANNGSGPVGVPTSPSGIAVADFDADGRKDIAIAGASSIGLMLADVPVTATIVTPVPNPIVVDYRGSAKITVNLTGTGPWNLKWSDGYNQSTSTTPLVRTVSPTADTTYTITSVMGHGSCAGVASGSASVSATGATSMVLSASPATAYSGQTVTVKATVSAATTPTGSVQFYDGTAIPANLKATIALASGVATWTTNTLTVAAHTLTAHYVPTGIYHTSADKTANVNVLKANTTTALTSTTPNPSPVNTAVSLKATVAVVSPGVGTPTGTVTFYANNVQIGSPIALAGGIATTTWTPTVKATYTVVAKYSGSATHNASNSTSMSRTVN